MPLFLLFDFGGDLLRGAAALGVLVSYLLHSLEWDETCFIVAWVAVLFQAGGQIIVAFSTFGLGARAIGLGVLAAAQTSLVGVWLSLHFHWLPVQHPDVACLCERLLFNLLPLPSACIVAWGVGAIWGSEPTPMALLATLAGAHCLLGGSGAPASFAHLEHPDEAPPPPPQQQQQQQPPKPRPDKPVPAGDADSANVIAACVVLLPSLYYLALHSPTLSADASEHLRALRTLVCLGVLVVTLVPPHAQRGWLAGLAAAGSDRIGKQRRDGGSGLIGGGGVAGRYEGQREEDDEDAEDQEEEEDEDDVAQVVLSRLKRVRRVRLAVIAIALTGLTLAAHTAISRSVADGNSLMLVVTPPLGVALLALALSGPPLLFLLYLASPRGELPPAVLPTVTTASLSALTLLLGLPTLYLLAALVAALSGARAYTARSPGASLLCGVCVTSLTHGVLSRTTGIISHSFASTGVSLEVLCATLVAMTALCAVAVGATLLRSGYELRAGALLAHALLLAGVEAALLEEDEGGIDGGAAVYPAPLVGVTVVGGLILCERLHTQSSLMSRDDVGLGSGGLGDGGLGGGLGGARGAGSTPQATPPTLWWLLLAAHAGRAALLLETSASTYVDGCLLVAALTQGMHIRMLRHTPPPGEAVPAWLLPRLCLLLLATYRAHCSLLPPLLAPLSAAFSQADRAPLLLGGSILLGATGAHLLASHSLALPRHRALAVRLCAWLVAAGTLLAAVQPVLDVTLLVESILWTLFHPTASLTFGGTPRLLLWPPWLLYVAALAILSAVLNLIPLASLSTATKLCGCATLGAASALTAAGAMLPLERSLYLLIALASALGGAFLGVSLWPRALVHSPRAPSLLLSLFYALAPLGLAAISHAFHHSSIARSFGAERMYRTAWCALYAGVSATGALLTRLHAAQAYDEDAAARGSPQRGSPQRLGAPTGGAGGGVAASPFGAPASGVSRSSVALRAEAYEQRQAAKRAGLEWVGGVGNVCSIAALCVCLYMHVELLEGTARGVLPTAPLLLLLHPHTPPFRSLATANRYAPVGSAIAAAMVIAGLLELNSRAHDLGFLSVGVMRGLLLLCCSLPSLILCCKFMWDFRQTPPIVLYCSTPLTSVPLLLSHARPIYDLAGLSLLAAILHLVMARSVRKAGNKQ